MSSESIRSRVTSARGSLNVSTRIVLPDEGPRVAADRMVATHRAAAARFAAEPEPRSENALYRLYWGREDRLESIELSSDPEGFAVVGRHTRADVCIPDAEVSLRHLLVRASVLDDGRKMLRVLDLKAALPFHLVDDLPQRSVVASGPLTLRLGRYVLIAFPFGEPAPEEPIAPDVRDAAGVGDALRPSPDESAVTSRVSSVPGTSSLVELAKTRLGPGDGRVIVERDGRAAAVAVSREALARGVLVGRASRCLDGGIRDLLDAEISRAHLLLLAEAGEVHAFDLCSTNGTRRRGQRVRHVRLRDEGTELRLSGRGGVRLSWTREPDGSDDEDGAPR